VIVADDPWAAARFLASHNQNAEHPEMCQSFCAYDSTGQIVGAIAFHHSNALSVVGDIALAEGKMPKKLLHIALWYAFDQLAVRRLTLYVSAHNLKSIAFVERLGAHRGATLLDGCSDGDVYIYYLLPDQCPLWSKFNGKKLIGPQAT